MITNLLIVLASLFISSSANAGCQVCKRLETFRCTICYDECSQTLTSCTVSKCVTPGLIDCNQYQDVQQSQSFCFPKCCNGTVDSPTFNIDDLNTCVAESEGVVISDRIISIALASLLGLCLIISICGFCYNNANSNVDPESRGCLSRCCLSIWAFFTCRRCRRRTIAQRQEGAGVPPGSAQRVQVEIRGQNVNPDGDVWQHQEQALTNGSVERTCTICLEGESNTLSNCRHHYHLDCIFEWLRMRDSCPNCNSLQIQPIRIYCKRCKKNYAPLNLKYWRSIEEIQEKLHGQICQQCLG